MRGVRVFRLNRIFVLAAVILGVGTAGPAMADIFSFKDDKGIVHFTNIAGLDNRYKLVRKEDGTPISPSSTYAARVFMPSQADIEKYAHIITTASRAYGVDASLVHAVISAESGYDRYAVSRTGAMGLMQLMPDTARRYGVQNMMDPAENIHGGVRYLRDLLSMFKGRVDLAVAAYNAGENAVIRAGHRVPNYAETRHYVPKVLGFYKNFQKRSA
ncbi:MAG TPA: lytic transglycosylase domain-containing protein [Usitatibacter sp.]|nr:lytic transglycosylase domain-containing protein [Usitatibacter sp.]